MENKYRKLDDAKKEVNRFLYNLQKFDKIKEDTINIKNKLEILFERFGKRHIIKKGELKCVLDKSKENK